MKRILTIALLALSLQLSAQQDPLKKITGSPAATDNAPEWVAGQTRYFNMTAGGQLGHVAIVKKGGLPGLWNNRYGAWLLEPGEAKELFFASASLLFHVRKDGRCGFARIQPGFDQMKAEEMKELWYPFDEARYSPSRTDVQEIKIRMQEEWLWLGAEDFLPKYRPEKLAEPTPAQFIMRYFLIWGTTELNIKSIGREPGKKGAYITLEETPYGGPYFLPSFPADASFIDIEQAAFCVKDNNLWMSNAVIYIDGKEYWWDDYSAEPPIIPLNQVTLRAAHYKAARGMDGGLFFGSHGVGCDGLWIKKDGSFKFGWVPLHYNEDGPSYTLFSHPEWYTKWEIPVEMTFHEFYFGYELSAFLADPDGYDGDAVWEQAKTAYLKSNGNYEFSERYPMSAEGYDAEKQALKMVFHEEACPPIWIPMTAAEAKALLASVKKYGTDEHVWYYYRGLDEYGYDIVTEAGVGYSGGKVFRYKRED